MEKLFEEIEKEVGMKKRKEYHPGEVVSEEKESIRGHGTYLKEGRLISNVSGRIERVGKMVCIRPLKSRYRGEVGDVLVGQIMSVMEKSWRVDVCGHKDGILMLSAVNLPGGVLRRRTTSDQLIMRSLFTEGDLISAEVQKLYKDGSVVLHTRSLKYGRLNKGILVTVPSSLIKRVKNHFHPFGSPIGVEVILGLNGMIWIRKLQTEALKWKPSGFTEQLEEFQEEEDSIISKEIRENMVRIRNSILALSNAFVWISPDSIMEVFHLSISLGFQPQDMPRSVELLEAMRKPV